MRTVYYVETKEYYHDSSNIEHQIADGGVMPELYNNKKRALASAEAKVKLQCDYYGREIVIADAENPAHKDTCIYAVRLYDKKVSVRTEIRVYETYVL